jgi:hypothetical protein
MRAQDPELYAVAVVDAGAARGCGPYHNPTLTLYLP